MPGYDYTKNGTDVHLKWHLSLFTFRFICLHICSTLHSVASHPTTKRSSAIPNTSGKCLNILCIFL